jgi:hypothetical protein
LVILRAQIRHDAFEDDFITLFDWGGWAVDPQDELWLILRLSRSDGELQQGNQDQEYALSMPRHELAQSWRCDQTDGACGHKQVS